MIRVTLAAVISLDGKIKRDEPIHRRTWVSGEDKVYFSHLLSTHDVIVMGRKTYRSMQLRPQLDKHYVVFTRQTEKHSNPSTSNVEFTSELPRQLIKRLNDTNARQRLLLIGGSELYSQFLREGLVTELHLTIEPVIFGSGLSLINNERLLIRTRLLSAKRLNKAGTLLLKLEIEK